MGGMPVNSVAPHSLAPPMASDLTAMKGTVRTSQVPVVAALGKPLGVVAPTAVQPPLYGASLAGIRPDGMAVPPAAALAATAAAGMAGAVAMPVMVNDTAVAAAAAAALAAAGSTVL